MIDSNTIRYIKKYFLIQKIVDHADHPSASHTWGQLLAAASHLLTAVAVTTSGGGGETSGDWSVTTDTRWDGQYNGSPSIWSDLSSNRYDIPSPIIQEMFMLSSEDDHFSSWELLLWS